MLRPTPLTRTVWCDHCRRLVEGDSLSRHLRTAHTDVWAAQAADRLASYYAAEQDPPGCDPASGWAS